MADFIALTSQGLDELIDALGQAQSEAAPLLEKAMKLSLETIEGVVSTYPPSTEANRTKQWTSGGDNTWYERGYGPKWVRMDGTVNGRQTSQLLGRSGSTRTSWSREVYGIVSGVVGVLGSRATYAPYVVGEKQASFHARNGWVTLNDAVRQSEDAIDDAVGDAADVLIHYLAD